MRYELSDYESCVINSRAPLPRPVRRERYVRKIDRRGLLLALDYLFGPPLEYHCR